jgi:predicted transcriptional regulator
MSLSKSEEQVMKFLWKLKKAFMKDILDAYPEPKPAATTVATLLKRMQKKGFVGYEKHGSVRAYFPLVKKSAYQKDQFKEMVSQYFDGSTTQFASFFAEESNLTEEQLRELKQIIEAQIKSKKQ